MTQGKKAVVGIVNYYGMILVGKKRDIKGELLNGRWHIPGGGLNEGENYESALVREMMEETGIEIAVERYLASHRTPKHTYVRWYECRPKTHETRAGSDLSEVLWVPKNFILEFFDRELISLWPKKIVDYFKQS